MAPNENQKTDAQRAAEKVDELADREPGSRQERKRDTSDRADPATAGRAPDDLLGESVAKTGESRDRQPQQTKL